MPLAHLHVSIRCRRDRRVPGQCSWLPVRRRAAALDLHGPSRDFTRRSGRPMTEPRILPVLCAPTVIFPGPPVTMAISGTDALRSVEAAMRDDHVLFVVAELTRQDEQSAASQLPNLGVIASVEQVQMGRAALQIVLTSQQRATALDYRP